MRRLEVEKMEDGKGEKVRRSEKQKIGSSPVKSSFGGLPMAAVNGASGGRRKKDDGRGKTAPLGRGRKGRKSEFRGRRSEVGGRKDRSLEGEKIRS